MAWTTPRTWVSGELVTAALMNSAVRDNLNILKTAINNSGQLEFTDATQLTIASGVITVTQNYHKVDTEGDASSDDLDTITVGTNVAAGFILHLRVESAARTVVIKNGTSGSDNLDIGTDITLDESYKTYSLVYDGSNWRPFSFPAADTFAALSPLTTRGDLLYASSGTVTGTRLAVGTAGQLLGTDGTDVAWQTNVDLPGTLDVTGGTTLDNDLGVGSIDLYVDVSENQIGMGTSAPDKRLHIMESEVSGMAGNANSVVVIEENANVTWLEFMNPNTATDVGLLWSDPEGNPGALNYNHDSNRMIFSASAGFNFNADVAISGALSKSSGSFKIDHPLPSKTETHFLVHSFLEGPQCDLIYRGTATLSSGAATVNLDTASGMTEGTWVLLCHNEQCFTSNETGWSSVRGSVTGNVLAIECEEGTSTDTISWMVVAERHDPHIMATDWTDADGHVILEPEKPEEVEGE